MNTAMMPFEFHQKPVRVVMQEGNPWWVAKDVCDILTIANHWDAVSKLDDDEKGLVITETPGGQQQMNAVNESGLYHLIFQSRKAEAKVFRKWVTNEVLPQLRQTGKYEMPAVSGGAQMERVFAAAFAQMETRVNRLEQALAAVSAQPVAPAQPPIRVIPIADGLTLRAFYLDGQVMLKAKGLFPFSLGWVGVPAQLRRLNLSSERGEFHTYTLTDLVGAFRIPLLQLRGLANLKPAGSSVTLLTATGIHRSLSLMDGTVATYLQTNLARLIEEMAMQADAYRRLREGDFGTSEVPSTR